jgi:hypothetical protein
MVRSAASRVSNHESHDRALADAVREATECGTENYCIAFQREA